MATFNSTENLRNITQEKAAGKKEEYKLYEVQKTDETIVFRDTCSDGKTSRERNYHKLQDYGQLWG